MIEWLLQWVHRMAILVSSRKVDCGEVWIPKASWLPTTVASPFYWPLVPATSRFLSNIRTQHSKFIFLTSDTDYGRSGASPKHDGEIGNLFEADVYLSGGPFQRKS